MISDQIFQQAADRLFANGAFRTMRSRTQTGFIFAGVTADTVVGRVAPGGSGSGNTLVPETPANMQAVL